MQSNFSYTNRNAGLDVLRSLCLFLVVLQHSFLFTDSFFPDFRKLWVISHSALDLFFILSGFLIGSIIAHKYEQKGTLGFGDVFRFYKRRWYKTIPMYAFIIVVCLLLSRLGIYYAQDFSWTFMVFLQNLTKANFDFLPHTYSLTIEEWFYIIFPLALLALLQLNLKYNPFYLLIVLWIIVAVALRTIRHFDGIHTWDSEVRKSILSRIDATIYGVLFYFLYTANPLWLKKFKILFLAFGIILYLVSTLFMVTQTSAFFNNVVYYSIVPFFMSLLLPFFIYLRLPSWLETAFTFQSLASYSIYLVHLPFLYCIYQFIRPQSAAESLFLTAAFLLLAYLVGSILYLLIEKPIMNLREKS
jgi:peptidoglycan/LPS O-acetylase OafA/YrhL